jgi:hypothetical protein
LKIGNQNKSEIGNQNKSEIGNQNKSEIGNQNKSEIGSQNKSEIGNQNKSEIGNQNKSEIGNQNKSEIGNQNKSEIGNQNKSEIGNHIPAPHADSQYFLNALHPITLTAQPNANSNTQTLENSNTRYLRPLNSSIMIQRIQTIYLLLAAISLVCPVFLPLATATGDQAALLATGDNFFADGTFWSKEHPAGYSLFILIAGIFSIIFLYKNRPKQMQSAGVMAFAVLIFIVLYVALGALNAQRLPDNASVQPGIGAYPPVLAIVFLILAYRAIKKDENLVRSSDRLR